MNFRRLIKILWASPCSTIGLMLAGVALLLGGRMRAHAGMLEVTLTERPGRDTWISVCAIVFGHVVIAGSARERLRTHEQAHVRRYERWGLFFRLTRSTARGSG